MRWRPITAEEPPLFRMVLAYRVTELYPIVAFRYDESGPWTLWEGGCEGSQDQKYPYAAGGRAWHPTHWMPLDALPNLPDEEGGQ